MSAMGKQAVAVPGITPDLLRAGTVCQRQNLCKASIKVEKFLVGVYGTGRVDYQN